MKNLIKKILKEQVNVEFPEGEDGTNNSPDQPDNVIRRIRVVLDLMKPYAKEWNQYLEGLNIEKRDPSTGYKTKTLLKDLLKIVGGGRNIAAYDNPNFETTYWFCHTFKVNGGMMGREFLEGEIKLEQLPVYNMSAQYSEDVVDYRTGWGDIVGVDNDEEAIEYFEGDFGSYLEDSESVDMDYGDNYDVEKVEVEEVTWIKFLPKWVGL